MRKEIFETAPGNSGASAGWFDLESTAIVRLRPEASSHPIEHALVAAGGEGWKAAGPGPQTILLQFDRPTSIQEIWLRFDAAEDRTQEFALSASTDEGKSFREIVRQQFNFSRDAARFQEERYFPKVAGVNQLKLTIIPDISGGETIASLRLLRIR